MAELFAELREKKHDEAQVLSLLNKICCVDPNDIDDVDCADDFCDLLSISDMEIKTAVFKSIAEVAKNSSQRQKLTRKEITSHLLGFLSSKIEDLNLLIQVCRALGNICFENAKARELIDSQDLLLYELFQWKPKNGLQEELERQFVKTRCGLISNFLLGSEEIARRAIQEGKLVEKIQEILKEEASSSHKSRDFLLLHVLPPLNILSEMIDTTFDITTTKLIVQILKTTTNVDVKEIILEMLQYQSESDEYKLVLAKEGLCEALYAILEANYAGERSEESQGIVKLAGDLLIQILNGDDAMNFLYKTKFVDSIEKWLDSYDLDLLVTASIAIGNFARSDSHCIELVSRGIMKKLTDILAKNNSVNDDVRLQHALLSALRNLVIPKPNKVSASAKDLVKTILPMLDIHHPPVIFKLLGTLRMAVDDQGQLAVELLQNQKLINQLVIWSKTSDFHVGVSAESLRLMTYIIKFAFKSNPESAALDGSCILAFIEVEDSVKCIVDMLKSTHMVMKNEALVALCILSVALQSKKEAGSKLESLLVELSIGGAIAEFISRNSETMTKEVVENLKTLVANLHTEVLLNHLKQFNVEDLMKNIPSLTEYCTL